MIYKHKNEGFYTISCVVMNKNDARWLCITIPSLLVKDKQEPKRIHSFKVVVLTPLAALKAHVLGFVTFFLNYHLYRVAQLLSKPPSPSAPPSPSSCFQMLSFEAMMPHLSYVSKERPCSALLNYWILLMPAPVGQEEEQVGGSQYDQSTWNIQLWIYTSFTNTAAALLVRNTLKNSWGACLKRFITERVRELWHSSWWKIGPVHSQVASQKKGKLYAALTPEGYQKLLSLWLGRN